MGRRATDTSAACRFVLLLALLIDTSLCEVHGANTLGTFQQQSPAAAHVVEPVAPAVAANPEAQAPLQLSVEGLHEAHDALGLMSLQDHYREPLVDLCLNGANVTMEDLRKVAPQVFLRLLDNEHWREALLNRTADLPAVLGSMAAKMMQDPGHHVFMSCEKQLLQKVFPQLASTLLRNDKATSDRSASARNASSALGSSHMSEEPVSAEGVAAVLSTTKEAVARFVGGFKEAAKSANLLQDEFLAAHIASDNERGNGPAKYTKQDFEKLLRDAKRSAFEEALSPTNMLQDTDFESEEHQSIRARFGDNPMPPSLHNSTVAEKLRRINYDMFSRGVLNIVRTNSGLILALCYGSILWEAWSSLQRDSEFDFLKREQLRNGERKIEDTASVEKDPNIGTTSVVMGGSSLDQFLYGSLYPMANKLPIPTHLTDKELKAAVLKGNDKTLYQNLSPAGRQTFKRIFHHAPARGVFEAEILGDMQQPYFASNKKVGSYGAYPELSAFDTVGHALGPYPIAGRAKGTDYVDTIDGNSLETKVTPRDMSLLAKDVGGFIGSLKMKVLRAALDGRSGYGDLSSRQLRADAMSQDQASLLDVLDLIYYIDAADKESGDESTKVKDILQILEQELREVGAVICYYGGRLPEMLDDLRLGNSGIEIADATHPGCPMLRVKPGRTGHLFVSLEYLRRLPTVVRLSELLDKYTYGMGLTPGAQLRQAQVNTADRIDKLFSVVNTGARINFALAVASYLSGTWWQAEQLIELSYIPCEDRDPDNLQLFWGTPMPGPACPKFGVAYFGDWIKWLANNGGNFQLSPHDVVGDHVDYVCDTAIVPDPQRRELRLDNNPGQLRLVGKMPNCVPAPQAYDCMYRESPYFTKQCAHGMSVPSSSTFVGEYDGIDILPVEIEYNPLPESGNDMAQIKLLARTHNTTDGYHFVGRMDEYFCVYGAQLTTLPEYKAFSPTECEGQNEHYNCIVRDFDWTAESYLGQYCQRMCDEENELGGDGCEGFFYVEQQSATSPSRTTQLCFVLPRMVFPINPSLDSSVILHSGVCHRNLGLRLSLMDSKHLPVGELRIKEHQISVVGPDGAVLTPDVHFTADHLLREDQWRYLNIQIEAIPTTSGLYTHKLVVVPMQRLDPDEPNWMWIKSPDVHLVNIGLPATKLIKTLGIGCNMGSSLKDLCVRRSAHDDTFVFPSEHRVIAHPFNPETSQSGARAPETSALARAAAVPSKLHAQANLQEVLMGGSLVQTGSRAKDAAAVKEPLESDAGEEQQQLQQQQQQQQQPSSPPEPTMSVLDRISAMFTGVAGAKPEAAVQGAQASIGDRITQAFKVAANKPSELFQYIKQELALGPQHWLELGHTMSQVVATGHDPQVLLAIPAKLDPSRPLPKVGLFKFVDDTKFVELSNKIVKFAMGRAIGPNASKLPTAAALLEVDSEFFAYGGNYKKNPGMFDAAGPVKAAFDLLVLYGLGCLFGAGYILAKNKDHLDPMNNVGRDTVMEMFNPLFAIFPYGDFYREYGWFTWLVVLVLILIGLASLFGLIFTIRAVMLLAAKANDSLMEHSPSSPPSPSPSPSPTASEDIPLCLDPSTGELREGQPGTRVDDGLMRRCAS